MLLPQQVRGENGQLGCYCLFILPPRMDTRSTVACTGHCWVVPAVIIDRLRLSPVPLTRLSLRRLQQRPGRSANWRQRQEAAKMGISQGIRKSGGCACSSP